MGRWQEELRLKLLSHYKINFEVVAVLCNEHSDMFNDGGITYG